MKRRDYLKRAYCLKRQEDSTYELESQNRVDTPIKQPFKQIKQPLRPVTRALFKPRVHEYMCWNHGRGNSPNQRLFKQLFERRDKCMIVGTSFERKELFKQIHHEYMTFDRESDYSPDGRLFVNRISFWRTF